MRENEERLGRGLRAFVGSFVHACGPICEQVSGNCVILIVVATKELQQYGRMNQLVGAAGVTYGNSFLSPLLLLLSPFYPSHAP